MTIPFNPQGKKTILTLEGGGTRGLITLMMLRELERQTGQPCYDLFDFVGGTSVGAIIAGGIAKKLTAEEMITLFDRFVQEVFHINWFDVIFRHRLRYVVSKAAMRGLLRRYFGEVTLAELEVAVILTVTDVARAETIFFVNRGPGKQLTANVPLWQAVEASATYPFFFEGIGDAVDGGVGVYGNAAHAATVEALDYLSQDDPDWRDGNVIHCSFGTGISSNSNPRGAILRWPPWNWPLWVLGELLDQASEQNSAVTQRHFGERIDFRRYQVSLLDSVVTGELGVTIPPGLQSNGLPFNAVKPEQLALMRVIGTAYAQGVDFSLTGDALIAQPPPGSAGEPYPSRLPDLDAADVRALLGNL